MWNELNEPEPPRKPPERRRFGWIVLSLFLIVTLVGSSVVGLIWIWQRQADTAVFQAESEQADEFSELTAVPKADSAVDRSGDEAAIDLEETADFLTPTPHALKKNRIVFIDSSGQIGTIDPTGEDAQKLTGGNVQYRFPAWSPDGERIAAIGLSRTGTSVNVFMDEPATDPVEIYSSRSEPPFYLYWSPDSRHITFLANHSEEPMALHLAPADGKSDSHVIATGGPFYWTWAADSEQILIHTGFSGANARLAFVEIEGNDLGDNLAAPGFFQTPGISADGRFLAYAEETRGGNNRIVIANQGSGEQFQARQSGIVALGWSPTANQLAFISNPDAGGTGFVGPLRLIDAESNAVTLLSRGDVLAFFWSPDGRYLAYIRYPDRQSDMNAGKPTTPQRGSVSKSVRQFELPAFDIVLVDTITGDGQILLSEAQLSFAFLTQFLPFFDQYALSHQIWSPGSDALILPLVIDGQEQIAVVSATSGRMQIVTAGSVAFWSRQ